MGFTDNALREIRALKQAGDNLALVKHGKDIQIGELEKRLNEVENELVRTTEENLDLRHEYEKEKESLMDKLIVKRKKVWNLDLERETQQKRLKRLIGDVLKNPDSSISLKDRLKLLQNGGVHHWRYYYCHNYVSHNIGACYK